MFVCCASSVHNQEYAECVILNYDVKDDTPTISSTFNDDMFGPNGAVQFASCFVIPHVGAVGINCYTRMIALKFLTNALLAVENVSDGLIDDVFPRVKALLRAMATEPLSFFAGEVSETLRNAVVSTAGSCLIKLCESPFYVKQFDVHDLLIIAALIEHWN
ncbi:hypothetical protein AB6A40_000549 [Gnathostoma spinigerum]|uniref:Uncharacterized protein n=1 Tax=Gnathostoma spinigerum TaxID=75299 RepID=A0ABD6E3A1_9BILA